MNTLLINGKIYQNRNEFVEALWIQDGWIKTCGTTEELIKLKDASTHLIDLQGKTVVPGFNDSHLHFLSSAIAMTTVQLYATTSILEVIQRGKEFLEKRIETLDAPLFGRGWNQDYFTDDARLLNRHDLDQISSRIPIVFSRACGHLSVCNSKALELLGITKHTPQPDGGKFDLDADGNPNGIFRENAILLLEELHKPLTESDQVALLKNIGSIANSYGITSVATNDLTFGQDGFAEMEAAFQKYTETSPSVRVYHQMSFRDVDALKQRIAEGYHRNETPFHRYGPLKLFVDGSLGARTALMRQPYADDPSTSGIACMTQETLENWVETANEAQIQVAIHAIGDGAMSRVLDAYQKIQTSGNPLRHGIVHCQITDSEILDRFKNLDILAYVQPIFLHYDMHIVQQRVGEQLASTSYAFNTMENLGITTAYGTDSPVEGLNVFHNIHCAVNRMDLQMFPSEGYQTHEKVDLMTAIDRYTLGGAFASFEEATKGRLMDGYVADLVVLDQPILEMDPLQLKDVKIAMTMVDGKIVYKKG